MTDPNLHDHEARIKALENNIRELADHVTKTGLSITTRRTEELPLKQRIEELENKVKKLEERLRH